MSKYNAQVDTQALVALVREAGEAILEVYHNRLQWEVEVKEDDSPLTAADLAANRVLLKGLPEIADLPIISEESPLPELSVRRQWARYWLIDPLDGTKEFIQRNGQFTVNVALIEQGVPIVGAVQVPVTDVTYLGLNPIKGEKIALKYQPGAAPEVLKVRPLQQAYDQREDFTAVVSHRHGTDTLGALMQHIKSRWSGQLESRSAGSSLKFCLVAEGSADLYPRLAPTSEWDTAAAQAILEAAGGAVVEAEALAKKQWAPLRYNIKESVLNPWFYALGDKDFNWLGFLSDNAENA